MFLSNKRPTIDGDRADQRRIIYCEMKGVPEDQISLKYEDGLWNEGAAFLGCCIRMHKALEGRRIPVEGDASEQLASMKEEELLYAAQRYFDHPRTLSPPLTSMANVAPSASLRASYSGACMTI